jgi:hypothetical protein
MVARHGVLCPVDWKPSTNAADTISNTLIESYEDRLANLQKGFDMPVTEQQNKRSASSKRSRQGSSASSSDTAVSVQNTPSQSNPPPAPLKEVVCARPCLFNPSSNNTQDAEKKPQTATSESSLSRKDLQPKTYPSPSSPSETQERKLFKETSTIHEEQGTHTIIHSSPTLLPTFSLYPHPPYMLYPALY